VPARVLDRRPPGLPASLAALGAPCYVHRASRWKFWPVLALALGASLAGLVGLGARMAGGNREPIEWVAVAVLLLFVAVLLRPATWRAPIIFAADTRGVHLPDGGQAARFVAWSEVGGMTVEWAWPGGESQRCVVLSIRSRSADSRNGARGEEFEPWALSAQGVDPEQTLAGLQALRARSGAAPMAPTAPSPPGARRWELVIVGAAFLAGSLAALGLMLVSAWRDGSGLTAGLAIPVALALASAWVLRFGWTRRS
jgi:hypothetical protein